MILLFSQISSFYQLAQLLGGTTDTALLIGTRRLLTFWPRLLLTWSSSRCRCSSCDRTAQQSSASSSTSTPRLEFTEGKWGDLGQKHNYHFRVPLTGTSRKYQCLHMFLSLECIESSVSFHVENHLGGQRSRMRSVSRHTPVVLFPA